MISVVPFCLSVLSRLWISIAHNPIVHIAMHVQAAYRPAHRQAPKRPVVPPKAYEPTIFERERVLATRVRITDRTLERLLPSTEQVISRRVANYRAAVPQEKAT